MKNTLEIGRAVPAFNFYNLESFRAITAAAAQTDKSVLLAASESAIKYMGDDFLKISILNSQFSIHLDHGRTFESCEHAIELGFKSVMIDGSALPFKENIALTKKVVDYAHERGVVVEAELGALAGIEDDIRHFPSAICHYTDPEQARCFVAATNCDSLAIAIGTSHGAYKMKPGDSLRFDILEQIRARLPQTPLVLHGASQIPRKYADGLGLKNADGIPPEQIRRAVESGINKVNVDSDGRLAWTWAIKSAMAATPDNFDPRHYLTLATTEMIKLYADEINLICNGDT